MWIFGRLSGFIFKNNFNDNGCNNFGNVLLFQVGQTKFHRSQHCERINNVLMVSETIKPGIGGVPLVYEKPKKFLSVAARGESANLPAWLAFDKQVGVPNSNRLFAK